MPLLEDCSDGNMVFQHAGTQARFHTEVCAYVILFPGK
jgi:ribosomal protein S27E